LSLVYFSLKISIKLKVSELNLSKGSVKQSFIPIWSYLLLSYAIY